MSGWSAVQLENAQCARLCNAGTFLAKTLENSKKQRPCERLK